MILKLMLKHNKHRISDLSKFHKTKLIQGKITNTESTDRNLKTGKVSNGRRMNR